MPRLPKEGLTSTKRAARIAARLTSNPSSRASIALSQPAQETAAPERQGMTERQRGGLLVSCGTFGSMRVRRRPGSRP